MIRKLWDWLGSVKLPIGKAWFTTRGRSPWPSTWQGLVVIVGFFLWIFATIPLVASTDFLRDVWLFLSIGTFVVVVGIKTQTRF
jgi:hypothetical protein